MALLAGFLDLTRLLGRVMGSDLLLSAGNTCAGLYKVLWVTSRYNIRARKRSEGAHESPEGVC